MRSKGYQSEKGKLLAFDKVLLEPYERVRKEYHEQESMLRYLEIIANYEMTRDGHMAVLSAGRRTGRIIVAKIYESFLINCVGGEVRPKRPTVAKVKPDIMFCGKET